MEELKCPKCGSTNVNRCKRCGSEKYRCADCQFLAPTRIFEEGILPSVYYAQLQARRKARFRKGLGEPICQKIGDYIELWFDRQRGGMAVSDSFQTLEMLSIGLISKTDKKHSHAQSYKCRYPKIQYGTTWHNTQGYLSPDVTKESRLPISYEVTSKVEGLDVAMNFRITFEETVSNLGLLNIWSFVKAVKCLIQDETENYEIDLLPAPAGWKLVYEGTPQSVTFANYAGSIQFESDRSIDTRISKHRMHAQYVMNLCREPTIHKGREFNRTLKITYKLPALAIQ